MSSTAELQQRLSSAQEALTQALSEGEIDSLPGLASGRETDLRELAGLVVDDAELRTWAKEYLERDRELIRAASAKRDEVSAQLLNVQRNKSVHRLYMSEGTRR